MTGTDTPASHATLDYASAGRVAYASFSRPERRQQPSPSRRSTTSTTSSRASRPTPACATLVIRGRGDVFCEGIDGELLEQAFGDLEYLEHVLTRLAATCLSLEALEIPVIAAVSGVASAAGFELALACDVIVAAEDARLGDAHTRVRADPGRRVERATAAHDRRPARPRADLLGPARLGDRGGGARARPARGPGRRARRRRRGDRGRASPTSRGARSRRASARSTAASGSTRPSGVEHERAEFLRYLREPHSDAIEGFRAAREGRRPTWA